MGIGGWIITLTMYLLQVHRIQGDSHKDQSTAVALLLRRFQDAHNRAEQIRRETMREPTPRGPLMFDGKEVDRWRREEMWNFS